MYDDRSDEHRIALDIRAGAFAALSVTHDDQPEFTSERQLRTFEEAARRILAMGLDDESVNDLARSMLDRVASARRWTWVNLPAVVTLSVVALTVGIGTAVLGEAAGNAALGVLGGIVGCALLCIVVLRYRREKWRIRAARIAPTIRRHGV